MSSVEKESRKKRPAEVIEERAAKAPAEGLSAKMPTFPSRDEWHWRWMYFPDGRVLHRVAELEERWDEYEGIRERMPHGEGRTICGRKGYLSMPGFLSRMGTRRCRRCSEKLGIPEGEGVPYNKGIEEPGVEGPEEESSA